MALGSEGDIPIGSVNVRVQADEAQIKRAHEMAGKAAGDAAAKQVGQKLVGVSGGAAVHSLREAGSRQIEHLLAFLPGTLGRKVGRTVGVGPSAGATAVATAVAGRSGAAAAVASGSIFSGPLLPVIGAFALAGFAAKKVASAFGRLSDGVSREAARLSRVSGLLASVQEEKQRRQLQRDRDRARIIGTSVARIELTKQDIRDRLAPIEDRFRKAINELIVEPPLVIARSLVGTITGQGAVHSGNVALDAILNILLDIRELGQQKSHVENVRTLTRTMDETIKNMAAALNRTPTSIRPPVPVEVTP